MCVCWPFGPPHTHISQGLHTGRRVRHSRFASAQGPRHIFFSSSTQCLVALRATRHTLRATRHTLRATTHTKTQKHPYSMQKRHLTHSAKMHLLPVSFSKTTLVTTDSQQKRHESPLLNQKFASLRSATICKIHIRNLHTTAKFA